MSTNEKFGTVLGCMDGRSVVAITEFLKKEYGISYPDMITGPGIDKILSNLSVDDANEYRRRTVDISINHHGSKLVVVSGHDDCAGNPVSKDEHAALIKSAIEVVKGWNLPEGVEVIGLWVAKSEGGNWIAEKVA